MVRQAGFSVTKLLVWMVALAAVVWSAYVILPVYITYWKVQDALNSLAEGMVGESEAKVRLRLPEVFKIKYIDRNDLPDAFYRNLVIDVGEDMLIIESEYSETIWLIGPVQSADSEGNYDEENLKGMDKLRARGRLDFEFHPYAEFP